MTTTVFIVLAHSGATPPSRTGYMISIPSVRGPVTAASSVKADDDGHLGLTENHESSGGYRLIFMIGVISAPLIDPATWILTPSPRSHWVSTTSPHGKSYAPSSGSQTPNTLHRTRNHRETGQV